MKKIFYLFLIIILIVPIYFFKVYAYQEEKIQVIHTIKLALSSLPSVDPGGSGASNGIEDFKGSSSIKDDEIKKIGNNIIQILSTVASIISVLVLILLGIKYMFGSVEEKAEYKKTLMPYIIGATLVFAAAGLAGVIYSIAINVFK